MPLDIKMDGLTLAVASVSRSLKFYSETLGFKVIVDSTPDFAMVQVGGKSGPTIGFLALKWAVGGRLKRVPPAMQAGAHLELSTADLDGLHKKLLARGVTFDGPPEDRSWGERSAYATDPDGYTLEFAQGERVRPSRKRARR